MILSPNSASRARRNLPTTAASPPRARAKWCRPPMLDQDLGAPHSIATQPSGGLTGAEGAGQMTQFETNVQRWDEPRSRTVCEQHTKTLCLNERIIIACLMIRMRVEAPPRILEPTW